MNTLIFRTIAPFLVALMLLFSVFILLRGHNEPGGGFIGGLIAASAIAIFGIAAGPEAVRRALKADPMAYAGFGLVLAALSGLVSLPFGRPFLTGLWSFLDLGESEIAISTPLFFDIGVYAVVVGSTLLILTALAHQSVRGHKTAALPRSVATQGTV